MARAELVLFLAVLCLSSALPFCAAAYTTEQHKGSEQPPALQSVDVERRTTALFPLQGNVYPDGVFYATLMIGNPPRPYFLDMDTGSDLTWLQCDAPCVRCSKGPHPLYKPTKDKLIPCENPICASLPRNKQQHPCQSPKDQCDYEVEYADHGFSRGVLIGDTFSMPFHNGSVLRSSLAFGCGYDQQTHGMGASSPTDGMLGLGFGASGITSQLRALGVSRNVVGHCLSRQGGGLLFIGEDLVPSSDISWTPMSRRVSPKYYAPGPADLFFGGKLFGKNFHLIFDSGSSYTYFSSKPYQAFLGMVVQDLKATPLKNAPEDRTLPRCWKGAKPFKSIDEVRGHFKPLALGFSQGKKAQLDIPPESYLIITKYGNVCLGILDGTEVGLADFSILGDISMQDMIVIYDNDKGQIGWARSNCKNADRHESIGGMCRAETANVIGALAGQCSATDTSPVS